MDLPVISIVEPGRSRVNAVRDAAALVCAASAGVHAALVPAHLREGTLIGGAFALSVVLLAATAYRLRSTTPGPAYWVAAVLLGVAGCYLLSRTTGLPLLISEPEPVDVFGTLTSLAEVAAALAVLGLPRIRKEL
jgi:hypothetical protein